MHQPRFFAPSVLVVCGYRVERTERKTEEWFQNAQAYVFLESYQSLPEK